MRKVRFSKTFFYLLAIFISLQIAFCQNSSYYRFKCDVDSIPLDTGDFKHTIERNSPNDKRKLDDVKVEVDEDGFKEFNIYVDFVNIEKGIAEYGLEKNRKVYYNSINKAVETIKKLLKVKYFNGTYNLTNQTILNMNIESWNTSIFGDEATAKGISPHTLGYDLIIFGRIRQLSGGLIASAVAQLWTIPDGQPVVGTVSINADMDYSLKNSEETFVSTILHEFTHILGFHVYFFQYYYNNIVFKPDRYNITRGYINSTKAVAVARKYFNCSEINEIELEDYGSSATVGSHWEARILTGELMNGVLSESESVVSEFTLAVLEDTGCYKANYYTGGLMRFGKNKGCEFVYGKCVNKSTYKPNPAFGNEFYDFSDNMNNPFPISGCASSRLGRGYFYLLNYPVTDEFNYYSPYAKTGYPPADFCPVNFYSKFSSSAAYMSSSCSEVGDGDYIYSISRVNGSVISNKSGDISDYTGETISNTSFCFISTLVANDTDSKIIEFLKDKPRGVCYQILCSEKTLTVKIFDDYLVCPRAGGTVKLDGYEGYFLCPDYNMMCSGTVICNDQFSCIDLKSQPKNESYIYDYQSVATQQVNASNLIIDNTTNYELSEDGICPLHCSHCKANKVCKKCRDDLVFLGNFSTGTVVCAEKANVTEGYYQENGIYYKCMDNCAQCSNNRTCDECDENCSYNTTTRTCVKNKKSIIVPQIRTIDESLYVYMVIDYTTRQTDKYSVKIDRTVVQNNRNLKEKRKLTEQTIELYPDKDYLSSGTQVVQLKTDLDDDASSSSITLLDVTPADAGDTNYEIKLNNNLNNLAAENDIKNGGTDYSQLVGNNSTSITSTTYNVDWSGSQDNCEFSMTADKAIDLDEAKTVELNFVNKDETKQITATCQLDKSNNKNIPCTYETNIDGDFKLNNYVKYDESKNSVLSIFPNDNIQNSYMPLTCEIITHRNVKKSSSISGGAIAGIVVGSVAALAIICVVFGMIKKAERARMAAMANSQGNNSYNQMIRNI